MILIVSCCTCLGFRQVLWELMTSPAIIGSEKTNTFLPLFSVDGFYLPLCITGAKHKVYLRPSNLGSLEDFSVVDQCMIRAISTSKKKGGVLFISSLHLSTDNTISTSKIFAWKAKSSRRLWAVVRMGSSNELHWRTDS